jgi:aquaporin Z
MANQRAPQSGQSGQSAGQPAPHPITVAIEENRRNFADPSREARRLFSEALGTFLLTLAGAGAHVVNATVPGAISHAAAATAPGLTVLAVILFMGAVSGAHLNPAVTLGFAARGDFPWNRVPGYILAQLLGATLACLFLKLVFGPVGKLGATLPGAHVSDWQALAVETILTAGLVSVILGTSSGAQNLGPISAFGVGAYIILAGLWAGPISDASMNPARTFGPDLARWDFTHYWVYLLGPLVGAALAVGAAWLLRGPGGDLPAILAAQGKLDFPDDIPHGQTSRQHGQQGQRSQRRGPGERLQQQGTQSQQGLREQKVEGD